MAPKQFIGPHFGDLGRTFDFFEDGSMQWVRLLGHSAGQVGVLARTEAGQNVFFIADAAWTEESLRKACGPHRLAHAIFDNARVADATLQALHRISKSRSDITLIPSNGEEPTPWDVAPIGMRASQRQKEFTDGTY